MIMRNKTLIITTIAWVVGLSALGAVTFANNTPAIQGQWMFAWMMPHGEHPKGWFALFGHQERKNDAAHTAMLAWDYAAFIAAIGDAPFAEDITEEQFATIAAKMQQEQAIQSAIENNDYDAYLTVVQSVFAQTSSEAFFNDMVTKRLVAEKIKAAIEAEDYEAYVQAVAGTEHEWRVTEEQFAEMIDHKTDMMSWDKREGMRKNMQNNRGVKNSSNASLQAAVMAGDYDAFVQAIAGTALEGKITELQFDSVVAKFTK